MSAGSAAIGLARGGEEAEEIVEVAGVGLAGVVGGALLGAQHLHEAAE